MLKQRKKNWPWWDQNPMLPTEPVSPALTNQLDILSSNFKLFDIYSVKTVEKTLITKIAVHFDATSTIKANEREFCFPRIHSNTEILISSEKYYTLR